jgi:hypothetical protein
MFLAKRINDEQKLAPRAPIRAVVWYASDACGIDDLRVRVYTILASSSKHVYEFERTGQDWDGPTQLADNQNVASENASLAVCRERVFNDDTPIFVFFKPTLDHIDFAFPRVGPTLTTQAQDLFRPRGIPISL